MADRVRSDVAARQQSDEPSSDSAVREEINALHNRAEAAEQQRDEYLRLLQATQADFENYQKRKQRDQAEDRRFAHAPFAQELLPLLDNLQRALDAANHSGADDPLVQGVVLMRMQLLELLRRFGITSIDPQNQPFDPMVHEAVIQRTNAGVKPGTVVEVLEPGYRLHDRILRPARVAVAGPPHASGGASDSEHRRDGRR
jgi:molecular chaperone GrpE